MGLKASEKALKVGLKSLEQVSKQTGISRQTLNNWSKNKPDLFDVVLIGVAHLKGVLK